ncbi:MAG: hypothetical protein QOF06_1647 [Solirubrobacterales bacterium]|nr:hypothetical protein [Solirubrobacterales bacterium]
MSILDDAIREHLELKRAHGADESELKRLEDEAFGPPGRPEEPDPLAEAPTEFMATPGAEAATEAPDAGGRRINIADLQEPPEPEAALEEEPIAPAEDPIQAAPPAEEPSAAEHEIVAETPDAGHSTEERHVIAEQPTEFFDVQAEMGTEDAPPAEAPSPSDEEIAEVEAAEPKLAPVEPPTEIHASRAEAPAEEVGEEEEEDEDFWSEQRLSDELDQALEAPLDEEDEAPLDEEDEAPLAEAPRAEEPISEEHEQPEASAEPEQNVNYDPDTGHEDVLEDTPDFLEDTPEDDELWFEQRPPKDFDFDD